MRNPRTPPWLWPGTLKVFGNCLTVTDSLADSSTDSLRAKSSLKITEPDSSDSFSRVYICRNKKRKSFPYAYKGKLSVTVNSLKYIHKTICKTVSELSKLSVSKRLVENEGSNPRSIVIPTPLGVGTVPLSFPVRGGTTPENRQSNRSKNWVVMVVRLTVRLTSAVNANALVAAACGECFRAVRAFRRDLKNGIAVPISGSVFHG